MTNATISPTTNDADLVTRNLWRAVAAIRIFFGLDWLSNAIAKLIGVKDYNLGFITLNLVDRGVANGILRQSVESTKIAPLRWFYSDVVLAHFELFQWFLTVTEFAIGVGLLFGIASRLAAVGGLLLLTPIWLMLLTTNQYFWTYPLDVVPLVLLAAVPTGRYWGLDARISTKLGRSGWPF